ncbi:MAG: hypothetical protein KDB70_15395 [Mycobacterium sp.]|nr:hypothetical protein [Mycobacterium sp.]
MTPTPAYDVARYKLPADDAVWTTASWEPTRGELRSTDGDYVSADDEGEVWLACGIESATTELGLEDLIFGATDKYLAVCDEITRQLQLHPWAMLHCPQGRLRVDLVPFADAPVPDLSRT